MRAEKFVLNKKAFQQQVLYGAPTAALLGALAGQNAVVERSNNARGGGRVRARIYGTGKDVEDGSLVRRVGGSG